MPTPAAHKLSGSSADAKPTGISGEAPTARSTRRVELLDGAMLVVGLVLKYRPCCFTRQLRDNTHQVAVTA